MLLILCSTFLLLATVVEAIPPNIIFILADDMGWNDVSFHGSDQIPTPNIDALAYNGVILKNHYSQSLCTPSRAALMTGRYPFHTGMQGNPIDNAEPRGLPLGKILPGYLKDLGYVTRGLGKWHLGFYKKEYTPTYRGFDSYLGYWCGFNSYYDHVPEDIYSMYPGDLKSVMYGHDFRRNMETAWDLDGQYTTDIFTTEGVNIIKQHNKSVPLFLYMAHTAVHAGNSGKLLEAPQDVINNFTYIHEPNRRTFAAVASKLDDSVGQIVQALKKEDMLNNSIIVFISDNGAPTTPGLFQNWGSNYPMRGIKGSLWQGGVRTTGLVWSPLIRDKHRLSNELMHISDWLPTLYGAAGGNESNLPTNLDGVNQWQSIATNRSTSRTEVILNIDEVGKNAAFIQGQWKLVIGSFGTNGSSDGYFGESGHDSSNPVYNISSIRNSIAWKNIAQPNSLTDSEIIELRRAATIKCNFKGQYPVSNCNSFVTKQPCLFDLVADPCEMYNLANIKKATVGQLNHFIGTQKKTLVPQSNKFPDYIRADPARFNNTWSPWDD